MRVVRARARGRIEGGGEHHAQYDHDHSFRVDSGRNGRKNTPRIVESRRAFCAESNLLPVQPRSELPACESFMCACAMRGDECKAEGSRLVRSKPLVSCRFGIGEETRRANPKLRLNSD